MNHEEKLEQIMREIEEEKVLQTEETLTGQIVRLVEQKGVKLFHDQFKEPYAALYGDGREILKVRSRTFRRWLAHLTWKQMKKALNSTTLQTVLQNLEGKACFDGPLCELHVRVAWYKNSIWYDLGDGNAVQIDKNGWRIINQPPILFKRLPHQAPQIHPKKGGDIKDLMDFINLSNENEQLLIKVITISNFIPGFPHVVLIIYGVQGSAKSTLATLLKELIDPSVIKTQTPPDSIREFIQMASHHWVINLDNLSFMPDWLSDSLSRACTGDGFSKRELYTDDDDIIYSFQRVLCINGINLVANKPDLLQRAVLLELEEIPESQRREEAEFWKSFNEKKPYILGAIFDILVKALNEEGKIKLVGHPRMADFTKWGCAISKAMGVPEAKFLNAYYLNIARQNQAAIEASPVALAIIDFMDQQDSWEGTPTELLTELELIATKLKINTKARNWPKDPSWLWRRIREVLMNLKAVGIKAERDRKENRRITLTKGWKNAVNADNSVDSNPRTQTLTENAVEIPTAEHPNVDSKTSSPLTKIDITDNNDTISDEK